MQDPIAYHSLAISATIGDDDRPRDGGSNEWEVDHDDGMGLDPIQEIGSLSMVIW